MLLHQQLGGIALVSLFMAVIPLFVAVGCAIWPTESKLALMRPLSLASLFGGLAGTTGGVLHIVNFYVVRNWTFDRLPTLPLAEAGVPIFVSFASLSLAWLLVAFGMRRHG